MTSQDSRLWRQRRETFQRTFECGGITQRKIRSADGPREQNVAAEHDALADECDVTRRVSGDVHNAKLERAKTQHIAFSQRALRERRHVEGNLIHRSNVGAAFVDRPILRMHEYRHIELALDRSDAADVINVRVREPNGSKIHFTGAHDVRKLSAAVARIYKDGVSRMTVLEEVGVLLEWTDDKGLDVHALAASEVDGDATSRSAVRYFSAATAAVVASPTAVVTCRVS